MKFKKFWRQPTSFRPIRALGIVVFFSAVTHVSLIIIMAMIRREPNLMSPVDFLGISVIFPNAKDSGLLNILGWTALLVAYLLVLWLVIAKSGKRAELSGDL